MKVLVTGKDGQLASEFEFLSKDNKDWFFTGIDELDITSQSEVFSFFNKHNFDIVINCAAYTAVDKSEDEFETSYAVNCTGVKNLMLACEKHNTKLIHFSTDYVFDGESNIPYKEDDKTNPIGVYGKTKRAGEEVLINGVIKSIIIRTSWVYSSFGSNFVKTMIKLGETKDALNIVADQIGSPTYARDLALATIEVLKNRDYEWENGADVFHFSNEKQCSWFEFAQKIFSIRNIKITCNPITSDKYVTRAKRPKYSLLNKQKFIKTFNYYVPNWEESLIRMLKEV